MLSIPKFNCRLTIIFCTIVVNVFAQPVENLDEMFRRKSRRSTVQYPLSKIEDSQNNYLYQPETFTYNDLSTGTEVWKMTSTPDNFNVVWDIGLSPWSADGKRMSFQSNRKTNSVIKPDDFYCWYMCNTDGSFLRPTVGSSARIANHRLFFGWSEQIPDVYYMFGWPDPDLATHKNILYKNTVYDTNITYKTLIEFPTEQGTDLCINKLMSADGRKIIATPWSEQWLFPATIFPDSKAQLDDPDGYATDRSLDQYGSTPESYSKLHDQYMSRDGKWFFVMPEGCNAWWRLKSTGQAEDGGPKCNHDKYPVASDDLPYDFSECWPENTVGGTYRDPFDSPYWSHFCPDQWSRFARGSLSSGSKYGPGIWDIHKHELVNIWNGDCVHHAWNGFTDWIVNSTSFRDCYIYAQKLGDPQSSKVINTAYTSYNGGNKYEGRARPGQSPDGTKVSWHSEFLNGNDNSDLFWSVVIYPKPPTDLTSVINGNKLEISFLPPRYTNRNWPYYTDDPELDSLNWPLLDNNGNEIGETLYAREIQKYHLWRAPEIVGPWQVVSVIEAQYSPFYDEDPEWLMLHPIHRGNKVSPQNKITITDSIMAGDHFYALTSIEHSGLESKKLSEILYIQISGNKIVSKSIEHEEGLSSFWTSKPKAPNNLIIASSPESGQNYLSWSEPKDSLVRYYNIYYSSTDSIPEPSVNNRIASIVKGTNSYLDWLSDNGTPFYSITSVDFQGNESDPTRGVKKSDIGTHSNLVIKNRQPKIITVINKNTINIRINNTDRKLISIDIISLQGRVLAKHTISNSKKDNYTYTFRINKYMFSRGIYYLRIHFNGVKVNKKLINLQCK